MSLPVRTVSRFLTPLIFAYALYLVITGVSSPGGAFGGGVVVGVAACLAVVGEEGKRRPALKLGSAVLSRDLGFGLIILASVATIATSGIIFDTGSLRAGNALLGSPLIVLLAFAAGMIVGGEMVIALATMLSREGEL